MATVLRAWQVDGHDKLVEIPELPASELQLVEQQLEDWLVSNPDALQDDLLVIGRQVETASGPLDILCLNAEGRAVVVELKRERAPRETVAQAIDYASWVATLTLDEVEEIAAEFLGRPLSEAFRARFNEPLPELEFAEPAILVVASRLDASTERMIEFLSDTHDMDINGLVFRFIRVGNDERLLLRASVLSEDRPPSRGKRERVRVTSETLLARARDRNIIPLVNILRRLKRFLNEYPRPTYRGSFRYFRDGRMLCGVNVAAYWNAPQGSLDVWVSHDNLAQAAGVPEEVMVRDLESQFEVVQRYEGQHQVFLRIDSDTKAEAFVRMLQTWIGVADPDAPAGGEPSGDDAPSGDGEPEASAGGGDTLAG